VTATASSSARIIGIGASAGGIDALLKVMAALPGDLRHPVCIVVHLPPTGRSLLPQILDRRCPLTVVTAEHGARLRPGHAYVAPPDRHLLVRDGHIELTRGPKENGVRPAVDTMLRSMAAAVDGRSVAVVLSGALGDGSDGARIVARAGGEVIVQSPDDALVPSMPERALASVGDDALVLPAEEIAAVLAALGAPESREEGEVSRPGDLIEESRHRPAGPATGFTCPECSGALWEIRDGDLVRYRCRIGHAYSEDAMLVEQGSAVEAALWSALEALEERAELLNRIAELRAQRHPGAQRSLKQAAEDALTRADLIRRALTTGAEPADAFAVESLEGAE
jgi:two-component system, chemotaxis family, protein-glutamate methylesterase/glutaminase